MFEEVVRAELVGVVVAEVRLVVGRPAMITRKLSEKGPEFASKRRVRVYLRGAVQRIAQDELQ